MELVTHVSTATELSARSALSQHVDAIMAAEQVCEDVLAGDPPPCDLALLFVSGDHTTRADEIAEIVHRSVAPGALIGVTAEGVIGDGREIEDEPAVSLLCASLPGTRLRTFHYLVLPFATDDDADSLRDLAAAVGAEADLRAIFFFGDPFSVPATALVNAFAAMPRVVDGLARCPLIGGMASAGRGPGQNHLLLDERAHRTGGVGVAICGEVGLDTLVSQGCRPIGAPMVITETHHNAIHRLGGQPAIDAVRACVAELSESERTLLGQNGLFLGRVINEYKDRFGRGDFLVRGVMKIEQTGAVIVGDTLRVGQTVQFHVRDAETASEDLRLLLDAQALLGPAAGGLLCTCNGRGRRLFGRSDHDAATISATLGRHADPTGARPLPLTGLFAAGEIGPVGDRSFVHGHTASLALFRAPRVELHELDLPIQP